jgi:hypothetical protein
MGAPPQGLTASGRAATTPGPNVIQQGAPAAQAQASPQLQSGPQAQVSPTLQDCGAAASTAASIRVWVWSDM